MWIFGRRKVPSGTQLLPIVLLLPFAVGGQATQLRRPAPFSGSTFNHAQLSFEENRGQFDHSGNFVALESGLTLVLDPMQATMKLHGRATGEPAVIVGMALTGGRQVQPVGVSQLPGVSHYLLTPDPKNWVRNVRNYARVHYKEVYSGIDLVYRIDSGQFEYDFVVAPGADPSRIKLSFTGVDRAGIDARGDLVLETAAGTIRQQRPRLYQEIDGRQHEVPGGFVLAPKHEVSFHIGPYDTGRPLIIDPVLQYSTLHGGCRGIQGIQDVTIDTQGNACVVGFYPWDCDRGTPDVFVTKFASDGEFLFRTNFGGRASEEADGIALDRAGNIYVTGSAELHPAPTAPQFPVTPDALQPIHGGGVDAFVTKLDPTGSTILYSTFLGGAGEDSGADIEVDLHGRFVITGETSSTNFPTAAPWQTQSGGGKDAFVTVLNPAGTGFIFSTYFGGSGDDTAARLAVALNAIVVAGTTASIDFPVRTTLQDHFGGGNSDAFVARLSPEGTLLSSTYFGGSSDDQGFGVAMDLQGFAYVTGSTNSSDLPTANALQPALSFPPEADAFLAKISPDAGTFGYATYLDIGADAQCLGLFPDAPCGGVAVDNLGNAYVTAGSLTSLGIFVTKVDAAGARRLYTSNGFGGLAITLRPIRGLDRFLRSPEIVVAGRIRAVLFPVLNAFDSTRRSIETEEGWLMKLLDGPNPRASLEENAPHITYSGTWEVDVSPDHSGGTALRSSEAGATATITFTGTGLQVIGRRDPSAGIYTVFRSFNFEFPSVRQDAFASPAEPRSLLLSISNLTFGTYTVILEVTGTRNNRSTGNSVWIDGINLLGAN